MKITPVALFAELRQTLRSLARRPGFSLMVVCTMALGLGATTAIFSLVQGVLLRPLPFPHAERVVKLLGTRLQAAGGYDTISYPNFVDWRRQAKSFAAMSAYDEWQPHLVGSGEAERLAGASVNASFFDVLAVRPAVGRFFVAAEDVPGSVRAVVLSYGLWQRRFGGDPAVVGRQVTLSGTGYQIVGVAPAVLEDPGLSGADVGAPALWRVSPGYFADGASRDGFAFAGVARLRAGVSLAAAQQELDGIMARLRRAYPDDNADRGVRAVPLQDALVAPVRPVLLALLGATGLLLLVAIANVATLLFTRSLARRGEMALRLALGAGRGELLRAALLEALVLSTAAGALGVLIGRAAALGLLALAGDQLPRADGVGFDLRVLFFAAAASALVGCGVGLLPALRVRGQDPAALVRRGALGVTADPRALRLRGMLLSVEVALSLVLLVGAGLMLRTLLALRATDPGFDPRGVLAVDVQPPYPKYTEDARILALWDGLQARLGALPGVVAVGSVDILPMSGNFNGMGFKVVGEPPPRPGQEPSVETRVVTPGFFAAAGVRLLRGRLPAASDGAARVAVVDEIMVRRFLDGGDAIGRHLTVYDNDWEVVGIVRSVRQFALVQPAEASLYLPRAAAQASTSAGGWALLRTSGDPAALAAAARQAVRDIDSDLMVGEVSPLSAVVAATAARARLQATLLAAFTTLALFLGCVGVYGLVAGTVQARRRELAIRSAVGAQRRRLLRLLIGDGLAPAGLGIAGGLLVAMAAARATASLLYGIDPIDPFTFAAAPAVVAVVALLAAWLPARRAAAVDPVRALREE